MCAQLLNRQIVLASRPGGTPDLNNFALLKSSVPSLKDSEVLIRTLFLTVDPYMRSRMNDKPSYIAPFELNAPISGDIVGEVIESKSAEFKNGDTVIGFLSWGDYVIGHDKDLRKLDPTSAPISTALGVLGMPGMTAYFGLLENGKPSSGETVVVSAAAGAVGSLVGQIAKIKGCRVVGIAGDDIKVDYLTKELGFDAAVNYKKNDVFAALKKACPNGVDIYFDNVGGKISDDVLKLINKHARIVICGQISEYNMQKPDLGPRPFMRILVKSATVRGFIVNEYSERFPEGIHQMAEWIKEGKIKYHENIIEGLENAPKAFLGLFKGENIGKQLVKVS